MTNVEKARLLHQLFPSGIPQLLDYIQGMCDAIRSDEATNRKQWDAPFRFELWLNILNDTERKMNRYGKKLHTSSRLFADQLFDGFTALYMVHCLRLYITTRQDPNPKFSAAIDLFFNP